MVCPTTSTFFIHTKESTHYEPHDHHHQRQQRDHQPRSRQQQGHLQQDPSDQAGARDHFRWTQGQQGFRGHVPQGLGELASRQGSYSERDHPRDLHDEQSCRSVRRVAFRPCHQAVPGRARVHVPGYVQRARRLRPRVLN